MSSFIEQQKCCSFEPFKRRLLTKFMIVVTHNNNSHQYNPASGKVEQDTAYQEEIEKRNSVITTFTSANSARRQMSYEEYHRIERQK